MQPNTHLFNALTSVYIEGKSVPPQTLVGHMLFPDDVQMQMAYDSYWRNKKFKEACASLPDPLRVLNPPPRGAMGAVAYRSVWGEESGTEPEPPTERELAAEVLRRFARSNVPWTTLANLPPADMDDMISRGVISGMLAGFCLTSYLALSTNDLKTQARFPAQPSKNIVMRLCEDHNLGREKYGRGRPRNDRIQPYPTVTKDLASDNWQRYRSVSHLWAAFLHLTDFRFDLGDPKLKDEYVLRTVTRPELLDLTLSYERFIWEFFDGEQHGRVPREAFVAFHVAHHDAATIESYGLPVLPESVLKVVRKSVAQYRSD